MYKLINTQSLIDTIVAASPTETEVLHRRVGGVDLVTMRSPDQIMLADDTYIRPQVVLRNAHKPGVALKLITGCFRLICSNGLSLGVAHETKIIHREGPKVEHFLKTLEQNIRDHWAFCENKLVPFIDHLIKGTHITPAMQNTIIDNLYLLDSLNEYQRHYTQQNRNRRSVDDDTLWGLFNYIQETLTRTSRPGTLAYINRNEQLLEQLQYSYKLVA